MKKILFYINTIGFGGAERALVNLAERFAREGDQCVLVTTFKVPKEYALYDGIKRISLFDKKLRGKLVKNLRIIRSLKKTIEKENPDILVAFMREPSFRAVLATKGKPVKTIVSVRNDPQREFSGLLKGMLAKKLYKKADGVVFQTEDAKNWFPEDIGNRSRVIFNQVDKRFFDVGYDGERKGIVAVGRLSEQKNHKLLIRAFAKIADRTDENLTIYGDGGLKESLSRLAEELGVGERVEFAGLVDNVPERIKSAKCFVLSSDYEGLPNALMEAMAAGVPCVSTDCPCGGPKTMIEDGKDGLLVPVGDEKALADAMLKVLSDGEFASSLGKNAKEKAKRLFAPDVVFNEWKEFLLR